MTPRTPDAFVYYIQRSIIPAACALLPHAMTSPEAEAMLLAIGLQESGLVHRHQVGGPATGFWQFERGGGVRGVLRHRATDGYAAMVCALLSYHDQTPDRYLDESKLHAAIEHNDVLACCFARLLLWTLPGALPPRDEPELAWLQYLDAWRPGKPHRETWDAHYARAWDLVEP